MKLPHLFTRVNSEQPLFTWLLQRGRKIAHLEQRVGDAEATLLEQKALLREIVNGALDAIVTIDGTGSVLEWNPQAERIFGFSRDEALGRRLADMIIPAQHREAHANGMQRFLSTGQATMLRQRIEITALRKNGEEQCPARDTAYRHVAAAKRVRE